MRIEQDRLGRFKTFIHIGAGILLALAWILSLAVLTQKGGADGRTGWFFGLCWLTIPILIYQTMVPAWTRAHRFANVYAFAALDIASVILWFSGWVAVSSYVIAGKGKGGNTKESGCDNFKFGTAAKCKLSEANIIFGVVIMLTFCATAYISFMGVMEYKRTGIAPGPAGFAQAKGFPSSGYFSRKPAGTVGGGGLGGMKSTSPMGHDDTAFDARMNLRSDLEEEGYGQHEHDKYNGSYNNEHRGYDSEDPRQDDGYGYSSVHERDEDMGVPKPYKG